MTRHDDTVRLRHMLDNHSVVGLRNRVIHGDDEVDFDIVWETVTADLPPVLAAIERHLGAPSGQL